MYGVLNQKVVPPLVTWFSEVSRSSLPPPPSYGSDMSLPSYKRFLFDPVTVTLSD